METPIFPAAVIGVITATFGGVIRDVLCDQKPRLFQPVVPLYATCSFIGAWAYVLLVELAAPSAAGPIGCIVITLVLRLAAVRFDIKLPS